MSGGSAGGDEGDRLAEDAGLPGLGGVAGGDGPVAPSSATENVTKATYGASCTTRPAGHGGRIAQVSNAPAVPPGLRGGTAGCRASRCSGQKRGTRRHPTGLARQSVGQAGGGGGGGRQR